MEMPTDSRWQIDYLLHYYDEHAEQARQHETLRATATSMIGAIMAGVVALTGIGGLTRADIPSGILIVMLGIIGTAISLKHYERNRLHTEIMAVVRKEAETIAKARPSTVQRWPSELRIKAVREHNKDWSLFRRRTDSGSSKRVHAKSLLVRLRLSYLWASLPLVIGSVGIIIIVLASCGVE
jgi:hypothetical protein